MFRALLACSLLALLSACGGGSSSGSGDPAQVTYAAELGVDLGAMSRSQRGLYTQDTVVGTGTEALVGKLVAVHYTGWLPSGSQFDTSRGGAAFQFSLGAGEVIAGWDEGIAGMKVGGKRRLILPSTLGYGARGAGSVIPPDSVLIFDTELMGVGR